MVSLQEELMEKMSPSTSEGGIGGGVAELSGVALARILHETRCHLLIHARRTLADDGSAGLAARDDQRSSTAIHQHKGIPVLCEALADAGRSWLRKMATAHIGLIGLDELTRCSLLLNGKRTAVQRQ